MIGVGNPMRGDDAAGWEVVRRLRERVPAEVETLTLAGEPSELLAAWDGADEVFLIDAADGGSAAGQVCRFDAHQQELTARVGSTSTHGFGVAEAIELGRVLGNLPPRLVVYAVEGADFSPGGSLSPAVESAVELLERRLARALGQPG